MLVCKTLIRLIGAVFLWLGLTTSASGEYFGAIAGGMQGSQPFGAPAEGKPLGIIHISPDLPNVIWVDLKGGAMHLLEQSEPGLFRDKQIIPISIGKSGFGKTLEGDLKTPVGVYQVTSYLGDAALADKYGSGAFPLNYPNIQDRLQKRTGSGIWLHGLPKGVESRPRLDSDGCVVIDNETLVNLKPDIVSKETLVVLSPGLEWQTNSPESEQQLLDTIEQWRLDWQARDNPAYLLHYGQTFTDSKRDLTGWKQYKTRVNRSKRRIKVDIQKLSAIAYPGESNLASVRFYQIYESDNYRWRGWKQLLWQLESDGQWRIVYEGNG
tara:strand:+ start:3387 stop:4358 length:972 start_codon:yes stop_codon:yes gene_type:complete